MGLMASVLTRRGPAAPSAENDVEELLRDEIELDPSLFGRLVKLASLRDDGTGLFRHELSQRYGVTKVDSILRGLQRETFASWLRFSLRQQVADWMGNATAAEREDWLRPGRNIGLCVIPCDCQPLERGLFLKDLGMVEIIVRGERPPTNWREVPRAYEAICAHA